jgi:hypothetical protein
MTRRIAALFLLAGPLLFADVTLRYNMEFKTTAPMPAGQMPQAGPTVLRIKGDKTYSTFGKLTIIGDLVTNRTIVIDAEHMRFASGSSEDYVKAMVAASAPIQNVPPQVQTGAQAAMQMFKADVQSRKTGRTETIQGIPAEESEVVISVNMNISLPNAPAGGPFMRMALHLWSASADDVARTPGLAELARYNAAAAGLTNPGTDFSASFRRMMAGLPGAGELLEKIRGAVDDLTKQPGMQLRSRMEMSSPMAAVLAQGQAPAGGLDPATPLFSMTNELVELSTAPIDDSVFQVPEGYREAGLEEIVKDWLGTVSGRKSQ